jgi:hypothetical protein
MLKFTFISLLVIAAFTYNVKAQDTQGPQQFEAAPSKTNLAISTGVNNINGFLGANFELNLLPKVSAIAGVGIGGWGTKLSIGARFYKQYNKGLIYGISYSTMSGGDVTQELETSTGSKQKVDLKYERTGTINLTIGKAIPVGKKSNRFYFEGGYAIATDAEPYKVLTPGIELSDDSKAAMRISSPGGLILGLGFSFGL